MMIAWYFAVFLKSLIISGYPQTHVLQLIIVASWSAIDKIMAIAFEIMAASSIKKKDGELLLIDLCHISRRAPTT
jgi:hypothetical protein